MLARAVELVARAVPRRLARADQVYWLGQFSDLAAEAAARAIAALDPQGAVTVLKLLGRGMLIGHSLQLRATRSANCGTPNHSWPGPGWSDSARKLDTPAAQLPANEPRTLADTVAIFDASRAAQTAPRVELTAQLGKADGPDPEATQHGRVPAASRVATSRRRREEDLFIFLNVSQFSSRALVLDSVRAGPVPLPKVPPGAVAARRSRTPGPRRGSSEVLDWLWDAVAAPVLHVQRTSASPSNEARADRRGLSGAPQSTA